MHGTNIKIPYKYWHKFKSWH